jgi:LPXTG-motif cell wall-anchored protein
MASTPIGAGLERDHSPGAVAAAGLAALAVAMGIGRFAFTPILPMMRDDAGLSVAAGGWLASANYLGYLVGALAAIRVRVAPAMAVRGSLVVIGVATAAMGLTHRLAGWVGLRVLAGVASAWVLIFGSAWCLDRLAPLRRPVLNGVVFAGVGTGIAGAGTFCLALMHAGTGSAHAWVGLGVLSLAVTAGIWPAFGENPGAPPVRGAAPTGTSYRWDLEAARLVLGYGAFGFGYIIPATFLPVMARHAIRDPAIFGWSWPIFGAAAALSTVVAAGGLGRVAAHRQVWIGSQLILTLGVGLPVLWPAIGGIMLSALFVGGTFMVITMTGMQEGRRVGGLRATSLMAAMTSAFAAGQIVGPILVGYVVGPDEDFSTALLIAGALLAAGAGVLVRRRR